MADTIEEKLSKTTKDFLLDQVRRDPGLPRPKPTTSFWQVPPHPTLADKQSYQLPASTDVAIIGSGITGCSVAKHLLDLSAADDAMTVTVFEARTLVSGATGRNGGLLTSFVPEEFGDILEHYGAEEAVKIARFANRNLEKVHELANALPERKKRSQIRRLQDVICFSNSEDFAEARISWTMYEEHVPEDRGKAEFLSSAAAAQRYSVRATVGAVTFPNGVGWPYRLVTDVWSQMDEQYRSRLRIETKTPVESITYDSCNTTYPYTLHTPRGNVKKSTPEFGQNGSNLTWSMANKRVYEPETDVLEAGTYYAHQNAITGDIFIGGEKTKASAFLVADDTEMNVNCQENFATLLPRYFIHGWGDGGGGGGGATVPEIRATWTGIMGFTGDRLPLVGPLPEGVTRCGGEGEWIAAGFNGYGMSLCWACGEAVAKMVLGMDVSEFLPGAFLATRQRIEQPARRGALDAVLDLLDA